MKKWLLRILVLFVVMVGMSVLALNIISGTGDTQKRGLEQSFSQILGGTATFGKLARFNLFPSLTIAIDNVSVTGINETGTLSADHAEISFASMDIILKKRRIEKLSLKNLNLTGGAYVPEALKLDVVGLFVDETKKESGKFAFEGTYGGTSLKGEVSTTATLGVAPLFALSENNPFTINIGSVQIAGAYKPYDTKGGEFTNLTMFVAQKSGKKECSIPPQKTWAGKEFLVSVIAEISRIKTPKDFDAVCREIATLSAP